MSVMAIKNSHPGTNPSKKEKSDVELIQAVARDRDKEAFQSLYLRYGKASLNLAKFMTGQQVQAEEVVQEAMLRVWNSAHLFKPGSLRSWILRIVAREATRAWKKNARYHDVLAGHEEYEKGRNQGVFGHDIEKRELVNALRNQLKTLSEKDRTIAALYFGSNLSQYDIALEIGVPQRTVSFRLKKLIQSLKEGLSRTGFTTAGISSAAQIRDALVSGETTEVLEDLPPFDEILKQATARSLKPIIPRQVFRASALATVILLAFIAIRWVNNSIPLEKPPMHSISEEMSHTEKTAALLKHDKLHREWTFENGWPSDLRIISGAAEVRKPSNGSSAARSILFPIKKNGPLVMALPVNVPARPFLIKLYCKVPHLRYWNKRNGKHSYSGGINCYYMKNDFPIADQRWLKRLTLNSGRNKIFKIYCFGKYIFQVVGEGGITKIHRHLTAYPSSKVAIGVKFYELDRIVIKELAPEDIPVEMKNPKQYFDQLVTGSDVIRR